MHNEKNKKKNSLNKGLTKIKTNTKGNIPWNKGIPMSKEAKGNLSKSLKGRKSPNKGKKLSKKHKVNLSLSHKGKPNHKNSGEKSNFWKGGITPLHKKIRMSLEYSQWRNAVFLRDNWTCQKCGKHGGYLEVHHNKISFSKIIEKYKIRNMGNALNVPILWDIDNGITYCVKCHGEEDKFRRRTLK